MEQQINGATAQAAQSETCDVPFSRKLEDGIGAAGRMTWDFFHNLPLQGAIAAGAIGLYAATVLGVAELTAAGFSAYVAYRILAYGETLDEALENTIKFEKGEAPEGEKNPLAEAKAELEKPKSQPQGNGTSENQNTVDKPNT